MCYIESIKKWVIPILLFVLYEILYIKMVFYFNAYGGINFTKFLLIGELIIIILLLLLIKFIFKDNFNSIDSAKKISLKKSISISIIMSIIYIIIMFILNRLGAFIFNPKNISSSNANSLMSIFKVNPILIICFSLIGSILEEIVYRKILFGYLYDLHSECNKYVRFITSALVSSIIFGATHDGVFHPFMFQYVTAGVILSGLYLYTKRISSPTMVHILYNLFVLIKRFI